eukprot:289566-Prorocentrum_minimum.AAC.1
MTTGLPPLPLSQLFPGPPPPPPAPPPSRAVGRWLPLRAYALFPRTIGSRYGHMLSSLARLAPAT